jgi:hypothetical protein
MPKKLTKAQIAYKHGFRSAIEDEIAQELTKNGVAFLYEKHKIKYEWPARLSTYTPDFLLSNGIFIEVKGRFLTADRQKMVLVKQQNPDLDIRMVFMNAKMKISANSKTSYAAWCEKHGFKWAEKRIPDSWLNEVRK